MKQGFGSRWRRLGTLAAVAVMIGGCTLKNQDAPPLTGPSEFSTSITVGASPDILTQDGASQSLITVTAHDAKGQPLRNVSLRSEIVVDGVSADFGRLSARNIVTGSDGQATFVYTAPPALAQPVDTGTVVTIQVTPIGSDFANSTPRLTNIRLVPLGVVLPPNKGPVADFTFSPATASENVKILFDASSSTDTDGRIVSYSWTFGDGGSGSGVQISRGYTAGGTYNVTLTVTDDRGASASTTKAVSIGTSANPVAAFTVSPTPALVGATTFFDATLSTATVGRRIVSFDWIFGDGTTGSGASTTHTFSPAGTYAVTLSVTDDTGKKGVSSQTVQVVTAGGADPVASFTTSPAAPSVNETVFFNATASTAGAGRTIASYRWDFGDGSGGTGVTTTHAFAAQGTFTVTLTVTDSAGRTSVSSSGVTVSAPVGGNPTAAFTTSPAAPAVNETVFFNGSGSTAPTGRTITGYSWNFGDGGVGSGVTTSHAYGASGTYVVTLTVTDSTGRSGLVTQSIAIGGAVGPTARLTISPSSAVINSPVQADGSTSTTQSGQTIVNYAFDFGDGSATAIVSGSSPTASHTYTSTGTFTITLTVRDSAGRTNTVSTTINVQAAQQPVASFVYSPPSPVSASTLVTFNASASRAPQNAVITSYQWRFEGTPDPLDPTKATPGGPVFTTTSPTIDHTFGGIPRTVAVHLTVFDSQGGTNTTFRLITVQ